MVSGIRSTAALVGLLISASLTPAQGSIADEGYYRIGTSNYYQYFPGCSLPACCPGPDCTNFGTTNGGQINTSDYTAGQAVYIPPPYDGDAFTFKQ